MNANNCRQNALSGFNWEAFKNDRWIDDVAMEREENNETLKLIITIKLKNKNSALRLKRYFFEMFVSDVENWLKKHLKIKILKLLPK